MALKSEPFWSDCPRNVNSANCWRTPDLSDWYIFSYGHITQRTAPWILPEATAKAHSPCCTHSHLDHRGKMCRESKGNLRWVWRSAKKYRRNLWWHMANVRTPQPHWCWMRYRTLHRTRLEPLCAVQPVPWLCCKTKSCWQPLCWVSFWAQGQVPKKHWRRFRADESGGCEGDVWAVTSKAWTLLH